MGTVSPLEKVPAYTNLLDEIKEDIRDLENVILCGHSFGGIQAIDITNEDFENIKGLIVIGSPVSKNAFTILGKNFETGITDEQNQISEKLANEPTDDIYKEWFYKYRNFYFNPEKSDDLISIITDDSLCVKSYSEAIVESSQKENKLTQLKNVAIPKLFIAGDLDKIMPPESAQYESKLGNLKLEIVKGAGHFVHYECPEETMKIINNFLT
jgi:pimeloyl-ACP methyl ester carboxylesterase